MPSGSQTIKKKTPETAGSTSTDTQLGAVALGGQAGVSFQHLKKVGSEEYCGSSEHK